MNCTGKYVIIFYIIVTTTQKGEKIHMANKIYTAFVSSAFQSLRNERNEAINCLLDFRVLPIGMEHFTVSSNGEFSDIQELIDESDFFIMLMGASYGSCDEYGVSWTEREYEYALHKKKPIIAIICDELSKIQKKPCEELNNDQLKQIEFINKISFARKTSKEFNIKTIISQFFNTYNFSKCIGWTRTEKSEISDLKLQEWRDSHKVFDISGIWYHVHLSDDDENYIRVGTAKIEQSFTPDNYLDLHIEGLNYNVAHYDPATNILHENKMKSSRFVGEYKLQENGEIFGIFNSKRMFNGTFNSQEVNKGTHRGIHDFTIDVYAETTERIDGEFHDEAPSPKLGRIFMFRSIDERNNFLLDTRGQIIEQK